MVREVRFAWGDEEAFNAPGQSRRLEDLQDWDEDDLDLDDLQLDPAAEDDLPPLRPGRDPRS